ncbi:unnamed protein product [Trichogramma brassicae]|uniref:Retrotransposon gag domain-containing protein n=1 Tax=Trichogramma brassicae TaxID=86971 RepID=A0A6H5IYU2_9HYME|nr:unnamed protein product [Trichogramma brassicae]
MKRLLQNWKISFAGGDRAKAEMFITRLAKCRAGTSVDDQRLIDAVQATLSGEADLWYRAARPSFKSWERFEGSFRKMFIGRGGINSHLHRLFQLLPLASDGETVAPRTGENRVEQHPPGISQRALQSNAEIAESNQKKQGNAMRKLWRSAGTRSEAKARQYCHCPLNRHARRTRLRPYRRLTRRTQRRKKYAKRNLREGVRRRRSETRVRRERRGGAKRTQADDRPWPTAPSNDEYRQRRSTRQ